MSPARTSTSGARTRLLFATALVLSVPLRARAQTRPPEDESDGRRGEPDASDTPPGRGATGPSARTEAPPADLDLGGARIHASFTDGIRLHVPEAADFTFEAHLSVWTRLVVGTTPRGDVEDYVEVPLVRPMLNASVLDGLLRVLVQPELAGPSPRLLDLHLDFVPDPAISIRVGQFRTPFSRSWITGITRLAMPDRGPVIDTFIAGRDTGLMVFGQAGSVFEYAAGIFDGAGIDGRLGDTPAPMGLGRVAVTPYGRVPYDQVPSLEDASPRGMSIGIGGFYRDHDVAPNDDPPSIERTATVGADLSLVEGPFSFFSEGFFREESVGDAAWIGSFGVTAQAGVFVVPQILELSARGGWIDPDIEQGDDLLQSYEGGIKGYFYDDDVAYGHHLSLALRYAFVDSPLPFGARAAGSTHRFTAQLQVWM